MNRKRNSGEEGLFFVCRQAFAVLVQCALRSVVRRGWSGVTDSIGIKIHKT